MGLSRLAVSVYKKRQISPLRLECFPLLQIKAAFISPEITPKTWKHGSHPEHPLQGCSIQAGAVKQLAGGGRKTRLNCWFKFMEGADIWALGGDSSVFNENDMNTSAGISVLRVPVCRIPPLGIWSLTRFGFRFRHSGDIFT